MSHDPNYPRYEQNQPQEPGRPQEADGTPRYEGQPAPRYEARPGPQYAGQPPYQGQSRPAGEPGFWAALFDLDFKHFITIKFATFIYVLAIVLSCLLGLFVVISGFVALTDSAAGLLMVIFGLVTTLIKMVVMRVFLEFVISMIRTAQNTSVLAERRG